MAGILPEFRAICGLVVAGGRATRLGGGEKALREIAGVPLVDPALAILRRLFPVTFVATPRPMAFASRDVVTVADETPDAGPLGGLASGLAAATTPWAFACAGDMPLLDEAFVRWLCGRALATGRPVVPRLGGRPEPLHAVWRASDARRAREAIAAGIRKMTAWIPAGEIEWVDVERLRGLPGATASLRNVNAPEDLAEIESRIGGGSVGRRPRGADPL